MKEIKVRIIEEYRGHVNPKRKYHLVDIETGKEIIKNLKEEDIGHYIKAFHLTLIKWNHTSPLNKYRKF